MEVRWRKVLTESEQSERVHVMSFELLIQQLAAGQPSDVLCRLTNDVAIVNAELQPAIIIVMIGGGVGGRSRARIRRTDRRERWGTAAGAISRRIIHIH